MPTVTATTAAAAAAAADRLGYPVVLKSADPDLVHKSDSGGVRLGLTDPAPCGTRSNQWPPPAGPAPECSCSSS